MHGSPRSTHYRHNDVNIRPIEKHYVTQLTPYEEDPVVHELLGHLEQFAPSPGFSDRVLSQVWRPAPSWLQRVTRACGTAFDRTHVWAVAGSLAATSAAAMVAITVGIINHWIPVDTAWSLMMNAVENVWRLGVQTTADIAVFSVRVIEPLSIRQSTIVALATASTLVVGMSAFGLHRTIRQYRNERIFVHAGK